MIRYLAERKSKIPETIKPRIERKCKVCGTTKNLYGNNSYCRTHFLRKSKEYQAHATRESNPWNRPLRKKGIVYSLSDHNNIIAKFLYGLP